MNTPSDIRKSLTRLSNMVANGQIDSKKANAIIYAANNVLSSIRIDEQQAKIDELELAVKRLTEDKKR